MGKKYIIELPENTHWIQWLMEGTEDHHPYMDFKSVEDLTSYTELDLEQVRKEAYEKGYKKCMSENDFDSPCISCDKYEQGLNDAWEAARKIAKLDSAEQKRIYGGFGIYYIAHEFSAHEAIEKIRQYEQEQEDDACRDKEKVIALADDIGIHKLYALAREIRGECRFVSVISAEENCMRRFEVSRNDA